MPIRPENRNRYPTDWPQISDQIRFGRARRQCECIGQCGLTHAPRCEARHGGQSARGTTVVLTVAHLDHTPEHCDPDNLRAMCQACHLNYDREHHAQTAARTRAERETAGMEPLFGGDA